jgi:REP element-mobilizing transposase RayT
MNEPRFRVFDPKDDVLVVERRLPHWSQAGTICFITFRSFDSLPKAVVEAWLRERNAFLRRHGINPLAKDWRQQLIELSLEITDDLDRALSERWHENLDACHGDCVLRRPELAEIVAESLLKSDNDRYELTDFVVVANHVHLLAAFPDADAMLAQCESWKHYTARQINRSLDRRGRFWQQDGFDHLVRSADQFDYLRTYVADNPRKADLETGEFIHYSKPLSSSRHAGSAVMTVARWTPTSADASATATINDRWPLGLYV